MKRLSKTQLDNLLKALEDFNALATEEPDDFTCQFIVDSEEKKSLGIVINCILDCRDLHGEIVPK